MNINNVTWGYSESFKFRYCQRVHFHNKEMRFGMKVMQYQHILKYDESICFVDIHSE